MKGSVFNDGRQLVVVSDEHLRLRDERWQPGVSVLLMACVVSGVWCVVVDGDPNTVVVEFSFGVWEMTQCVAVCCSVLCCTQNSRLE